MTEGQPPQLDLGSMLQMAQEMQSKLNSAKEGLCHITVTGESGGGMVTVTANCCKEILDVTIDPSVVDSEDLGMLQDLVVAAVNHALAKADERAKEEMEGQLAQFAGMLPPGMGFPG